MFDAGLTVRMDEAEEAVDLNVRAVDGDAEVMMDFRSSSIGVGSLKWLIFRSNRAMLAHPCHL